jgi:hypothetical protein
MNKGFYDDHKWIGFQLRHHDLTFFAEPSCPDEEDLGTESRDHDWILGLRYYRWNNGKSHSLALCLFKREYGVSWVKKF